MISLKYCHCKIQLYATFSWTSSPSALQTALIPSPSVPITMAIIATTTAVALIDTRDPSENVRNGLSNTTADSAVKALREAGLGDVVHLPGEDHFETRTASYWSRTSQLRPWAIVQPRDAHEVSTALRALVATPGCQIAIRSGGHMAAPGASSIEDGVTIDLGLLNNTTYDAKDNLACLGPSARWGDVYAELEKRESSGSWPSCVAWNYIG